jgi:hypothetical protein
MLFLVLLNRSLAPSMRGRSFWTTGTTAPRSTRMWARSRARLRTSVSAEVSKQLNVTVANILISATHDHSAIFGGPRPPAAAAIPENTPAELFEEKLTSGLVQAAKRRTTKCNRPGSATAQAIFNLNVNRDAIDEQTRLWSQEPNLNTERLMLEFD